MSNADEANTTSVLIAQAIADRIRNVPARDRRLAPQTAGDNFEKHVCSFVEATFKLLRHLRPGEWEVRKISRRDRLALAKNEQYAHLKIIDKYAQNYPELAAALGSDYLVSSDVIVTRKTLSDEQINNIPGPTERTPVVDDTVGTRSCLRTPKGTTGEESKRDLLHATISCKWTIRSDRSQNTRLEAQNLSRNRKGNQPHIVVVTGEPLPARLASVALSTGDIDCVYHFALDELLDAVESLKIEFEQRRESSKPQRELVEKNKQELIALRRDKKFLRQQKDSEAKAKCAEIARQIRVKIDENKLIVATLKSTEGADTRTGGQLQKLIEEQKDLKKIVDGKRLKDIADLPLDLAV